MESLSSLKALQRLCSFKGSSSSTTASGSPDNRLSVAISGISLDENGLFSLLSRDLQQPYKLIFSAFDRDNFEGFSLGMKWIKFLMHSGYVSQSIRTEAIVLTVYCPYSVGIQSVYLAKF